VSLGMEERRFLDLDHICDQIIDDSDRNMFNEAIRCYQIGSHRAAVILAWSVTADCLFRRIGDLAAENDGGAQAAKTALHAVENTARFEEVLIVQANKCDLIGEYDEKCLRFARDTRSKCAHPTGVVPPAEAVRHILHICTQIVLCRNGFRGISFIKEFVTTKLRDRHLFSNEQRIQADCTYFIEKVPDRVKAQFGSLIAQEFDSSDSVWLDNVLIFLRELFNYSENSVLVGVAKKLQEVEGKDRHFFSIIVGLSERQGIWSDQEVNQSKAHLRDSLLSGRVDSKVFHSFGNFCFLTSIDENDANLIKSRFSVLVAHISSHVAFQKSCGPRLLAIVMDGLSDEGPVQEQVRKGLYQFSCLDFVFREELPDENKAFVDVLIKDNWRDTNISAVWQQVSSWPSALLSAFMSLTSDYLLECSTEYPEDVLILFEAATALAQKAPGLIDGAFEQALLDILEARFAPDWYSELGEARQNFLGQVSLLQERYTSLFPRISEFELASVTRQGEEVIDGL
jgi:hypothetical protein